MKITTDPLAAFAGADLRTLQLNRTERQLLRRAGKLLAQIRETVTDGDLDDERGDDAALAAYTCLDLADEGKIDL